MTTDDYKRVTEVTYLGVVYGTLAALKRMLPRDAGLIIQVGSALAYRGIPLQSAYCAAKHAIQGFHDSLITELLHDKSKVKVTMVQLSAHNTPHLTGLNQGYQIKRNLFHQFINPKWRQEQFFGQHNTTGESILLVFRHGKLFM